MEKELARFLMNHLLENYFLSKKELDDELDVSKRNVQRILNGTSSTQEGNSALGQILLYFVNNKIPLFRAWSQFAAQYGESKEIGLLAAREKWLPVPADLTEEGIGAFNAFVVCLDEMAEYLCSHCDSPCKPGEDGFILPNAPCSLSDIAAIVSKEIRREHHVAP